MSNELEELSNGNDTFLEQFFPPLYDYHQTAEISFMLRAVLRRQIDAFKNCVTREVGAGGGTPYNALHGVPFSGFRHSLASISYLKDSAFTTVKGMQPLLRI